MMNNKIKIILEDDNEILGNGQGHPLRRQYLPTKRYVEILNKYNIKASFYIDIAHYLFLKKNESFKDFKFQSQTIEEVIKMLSKCGMDVQVHLHSQWINAEIKNNEIYVTNKWNIGQLTKSEQIELFNNSYDQLQSLLEKFGSDITLNSFKAGSWGLQPFDTLYEIFKEKGIKLVMGPIKGLRVKNLNINYTDLESEFYPYYTSKNDINKISKHNDIVVLPMTPTFLNWKDLIRYVLEMKFNSFFKKINELDIAFIPNSIKKNSPLIGKDKLNISLKPFKTHLKINYQKYWYLKNTFKRSYNLIKKSKYDYKLMVIETHTKDFRNNFEDIDNFLNYLKKNYSDIEFVTASSVINDIEKNILTPLRISD